jgi:hypothetical protein
VVCERADEIVAFVRVGDMFDERVCEDVLEHDEIIEIGVFHEKADKIDNIEINFEVSMFVD